MDDQMRELRERLEQVERRCRRLTRMLSVVSLAALALSLMGQGRGYPDLDVSSITVHSPKGNVVGRWGAVEEGTLLGLGPISEPPADNMTYGPSVWLMAGAANAGLTVADSTGGFSVLREPGRTQTFLEGTKHKVSEVHVADDASSVAKHGKA